VANNIRVRRAARALSKASDLHEMFEAMRHMLDFGEFTFANALVGEAGRAEINERAFMASLARHPEQPLTFRNGRVAWEWSAREWSAEWPADSVDARDVCRSRSDWSFRLPLVKNGVEWGWLNFYHSLEGETLLVDTNYLSSLFRREFTDAVARIFALHDVTVTAIELDLTPKEVRDNCAA
jgi:hypothetical protein